MDALELEKERIGKVMRDIDTLRESVALAYKEIAHASNRLEVQDLKAHISFLFTELQRLWASIGDGTDIPMKKDQF